MLSFRLGTVNALHWGVKPVLSYSKPHTFSTFLEKKKKEKMHLISPTRPLRKSLALLIITIKKLCLPIKPYHVVVKHFLIY